MRFTPGVAIGAAALVVDLGARSGSMFAIGFGDARTGFALVQGDSARQVLWRTVDAGASWHRLAIR
jgi:hypothetical protein